MILVTSGCSFSDCDLDDIDTWPKHLQSYLQCEHYSYGLKSQGNGLIMRKALYKCDELLRSHKPGDLLVGIMWSGPDRFDFYKDEHVELENVDNWRQNPTKFIPGDNGSWIIVNHNWQTDYAHYYYKYFHNSVYSQWQTLEYVLHAQWYLEKNKIPYFMMTFKDDVLPSDLMTHPELGWLYRQIDLTKFADPYGCMNWCRHNTKEHYKTTMFHPNTEQHRQYTNQVIIPYLQKHNINPVSSKS